MSTYEERVTHSVNASAILNWLTWGDVDLDGIGTYRRGTDDRYKDVHAKTPEKPIRDDPLYPPYHKFLKTLLAAGKITREQLRLANARSRDDSSWHRYIEPIARPDSEPAPELPRTPEPSYRQDTLFPLALHPQDIDRNPGQYLTPHGKPKRRR